MPDLTIKQGDTYPPIALQLTNQGGVIDLSSATGVMMYMKGTGAGGVTPALVTGACSIVAPASGGNITYSWGASDTSIVDIYNVEFKITWMGGGITTVPNLGYNSIQVVAEL